MKPAFVYFDLDDTLLDHLGAERKAQTVVWQQYPELQSVSVERWISLYSENNKHLWEQYGLGNISKETLQEQRFVIPMKALNIHTGRALEIGQAYLETYEHYWDWTPGAEFALNRIAIHFPCGILTNGFERAQLRKFQKFGLDDGRFELIISEKTGFTKPQPGIFTFAANKIYRQPNEILYVGDNYLADIEGGHRAGWITAWYNSKKTERTSNVADFTFSAFPELLSFLELS